MVITSDVSAGSGTILSMLSGHTLLSSAMTPESDVDEPQHFPL